MRLGVRFFLGASVVVGLASLSLSNLQLPLPNSLALDVEFAASNPGEAHPIIAAGRPGAADFFFARQMDETTVRFGYDHWGSPLITSAIPTTFTRGQRLHLLVEMPAVNHALRRSGVTGNRLRVSCDGIVVLDTDVAFIQCLPGEITLGQQSLGGTTCLPRLRGRLFWADGREIHGGIADRVPWRARAAAWARESWWNSVAPLAGGVALFLFTGRRRRVASGPTPIGIRQRLRATVVRHGWFLAITAINALVFAWFETAGSFRMFEAETFSSFYDYQAISLLRGHLDVPDEAIGKEAFVIDGKLHGYFGPTPALLRLPLLVFNLGFGELSRSFMLLYFVASLAAAYLILQHAWRLAVGEGVTPPGWATALLLANTGFGSTLLFLASRTYIYHEAILCGICLALWTCWLALRHFEDPGRRWWLGALTCGVFALHARAPAGLFALTFLGCVAAALIVRNWPAQPMVRRHVVIGALCIVGVLSFNGLSYLKFKTFDGSPLRFNREYNAARLAHFNGRNFHLANVPRNVYAYLRNANFRTEAHFPYFLFEGRSRPPVFPGAKIDLSEPLVAIPFVMSGLFALATLGGAVAWLVAPRTRWPIGLLWVGVGPMALAMFAAIATAQRYTGDFCSFLICAATFGLAGIARTGTTLRIALQSIVVALTLWAMIATAGLTLRYQGEIIWGTSDEVREHYRQLCQRVDALFGVTKP